MTGKVQDLQRIKGGRQESPRKSYKIRYETEYDEKLIKIKVPWSVKHFNHYRIHI